MCKLLVRWIDNPGATGTKRFDVIDVRDDSVEWGSREGFLSNYLRVSLPGVTPQQAQFLTEKEWDQNGPLDFDTGRGTTRIHARRWHIVESRINQSTMDALWDKFILSEEFVVFDAQNMLAWLEKKIDGSSRGNW